MHKKNAFKISFILKCYISIPIDICNRVINGVYQGLDS